MVDVFTQIKRSEIMQKIGPKHSKPERYVRSLVHCMGYRFRLHRKDLPGKPDMVFPKYRKVIFVHGCFWHGHKGCKRASIPKTNREFWLKKINGSMRRDKFTCKELSLIGWEYLIIWQCQIKKGTRTQLKEKIANFLEG